METITLYFDRCFGSRLPESIRMAKPSFQVQYQNDSKSKLKFRQDTPDDEWLSAVGESGWFVFSHDRKFHQIEAEISAIKDHKIGCFYLWGNNAPTWDKLCCFMRAHEKIITAIKTTPRPFIFDISEKGKLKSIEIP